MLIVGTLWELTVRSNTASVYLNFIKPLIPVLLKGFSGNVTGPSTL